MPCPALHGGSGTCGNPSGSYDSTPPPCLFSFVCTGCGTSCSDRKALWIKSVLPGRGALVGANTLTVNSDA